MPAAPLRFDAKVCGFRRAKDGIVLSLVVHPEADCIAPLAILPVGFQCCVELGAATDGPTKSRPASGELKGDMEGSTGTGRVLSPAERAIKMAHVYDGKEPGLLAEIYDSCGIKSCAEFKTNPEALRKFQTWEYINGYVQGRP